MNLTDVMTARDAQWAQDVAAGPEAMAARRAEYVAAGWKVCAHDTCPPFNCKGENGSAAVWLLVAPVVVMVVMFAAQLLGAMAGAA